MDRKDLHPLFYKKRRHEHIAQNSTMSSWIVLSWQFKGRACIDKAHQEGEVNMEDRIIRVHTQIIILTLLFITILRNIQDLGGTPIKGILHLSTSVSNKIRNRNPKSTYIPSQPSYNQAPRPTAPSADLILGAISQLMEPMNKMKAVETALAISSHRSAKDLPELDRAR